MSEQLKSRFKSFAVRVIKMTRLVKKNNADDILVRQLVKSSTSIGANYRAALKGRSPADFISRITVAEEEADETCYWLELFIEVGIFPEKRLQPLLKEAQEITAILTTCGKTAKENEKKKKNDAALKKNKLKKVIFHPNRKAFPIKL